MANLYTVDDSISIMRNLSNIFKAIGIAFIVNDRYGSRYDAEGIEVKATSASYSWSGPIRLHGISMSVTGADYKDIFRRVATNIATGTRGAGVKTIDLDKVKAKHAELKAMLPAINKAKEKKQEELIRASASRRQAKEEVESLQKEVDKLIHTGDFTLHRERMENPYTLTLCGLSTDDVRWLVALKKELVGS